jgi:hypothetical protein
MHESPHGWLVEPQCLQQLAGAGGAVGRLTTTGVHVAMGMGVHVAARVEISIGVDVHVDGRRVSRTVGAFN